MLSTKKVVCAWIALLLAVCTVPFANAKKAEDAGTLTASIDIDTGDEHHYPYAIRGLNNEFQKGVVEFTDPDAVNWTKALDLGWIRWPGGTNVNFFNWKTGLTDTEYMAQAYANTEQYNLFMNFYKAQRGTAIPERLSDFKDFLQQVGARTVIPINSSMDSVDSVYDLAKFVKDNHMPVLFWELANEPFFWQANPKIYANANDYLDKLKPYAEAIKAVLPDAKLLISYHEPGRPWNNDVGAYSNPYWDGINFHRYAGGGSTTTAAINDANEAIANAVSIIDNDYIPHMQNPDAPIFIGEYGVALNGGLGETVYHGIFNAESLLRTMKHGNVKGLGGFRLYNGYLLPRNRQLVQARDRFQRGLKADATTFDFGFYLAAPAVLTKVMDKAINNSSTWWGTTVTGGAAVDRASTTMPALYATAFKEDYGNKNDLVIVNKSDSVHQVTVTINGKPYNHAFAKVSTNAPPNEDGIPDPMAQNTASDTNLVHETTELNVSNPVSIAPYSVTRLEWSPSPARADKAPQATWVTHADVSGPGTVTVKWLPADGANTYAIKYGTSPTNLSGTVGNIPVTETSRDVSGLGANATYYFQVEAIGSAGTTASENMPAVETAVPNVPLMRAAYVERSGAVGVEWQSVPGATGYKVRYKADGGSYGAPVDVGNTAGTIVQGLTNGSEYGFQVAAYNGYGISAYSTEDPAFPNANNPFAPNDVRVTGQTAASATLSWSPSYAEQYMGYFEQGDGTDTGWTVQEGSAYTVVDHPNSARLTKTFKASGSGRQIVTRGSAEWDDYDIEAIVNVVSYDAAGRAGVIGRFQDIDNYYYFTYDNAGQTFRLAKYVNGSTILIDSKSIGDLQAIGLNPNVSEMNLRFVMKGTKLTAMVNNNTIMTASDSSLPSGKPGLWSNQEAYFDEVILSRSNTAGGSYNIYRSTMPDTGYVEVASHVTGTTWSDTNLQSGQKYYYKLKGVNADGDVSVRFSNIAPKR